MKRNAAGKVTGDKFEFKKESVHALHEWFVHEFNGFLADGKTRAEFDYGEIGFASVVDDLRALAEE
jgi:hypothetical protein